MELLFLDEEYEVVKVNLRLIATLDIFDEYREAVLEMRDVEKRIKLAKEKIYGKVGTLKIGYEAMHENL